MDVYDFCSLATDDSALVAIYDFTAEDEVFVGSLDDARFCDYADCEVLSFDINPDGAKRGVYLILNIET